MADAELPNFLKNISLLDIRQQKIKKNSFHTWGKEFTDRENFFYQQAPWQFLVYTSVRSYCLWLRYVTCVLLSSKDSMPILQQKLSDSIYLSFVCPNYWGNRATQQCPVLRHDSTNYHLVIVNNAFDSEVYTKPLRYSLLLLPLSFR